MKRAKIGGILSSVPILQGSCMTTKLSALIRAAFASIYTQSNFATLSARPQYPAQTRVWVTVTPKPVT
jgi:hypothetical protein